MSEIRRPVLRWLGGKYRLAPWIISHFPAHRIYVEPFGGAASVLLQKPRAYNETYNDLDGELVNLFGVLRSERAGDLLKLLKLTPYSRAEYLAAFDLVTEPVERARRAIVRSHLAHGTGGCRIDRPTGFRTDGVSGTTNVAGEWADLPAALEAVIDRMRGVTIECRPALEMLTRFDGDQSLIYLDPPYLPATRSTKSRRPGERYHTYAYEMTVEDHAELLAVAARSRAMILISGYPDTLYDDALSGWKRVEMAARAHRNSPRTEVLWINPQAVTALEPAQPALKLVS
ncbi:MULTISPECIES: DNA adenine methylase [unclassified Sphingomonas]|uniref:DNA adenine methylase n=1 Tax=unclassified Sphingomonas TaxID=196159 RepID=UPI0006F90CC8|nr:MULTISPECIES: DNA adenine methylase [unclassified Sphingomonas]KQX19350.1 DNA methyltransferase [Sphingomonas sp. Root1294]KQY65553.1 DNA methyltransferase [Sphingomonas sp. Root50]KRB95147.1 DNA methyltransferase [Sphingomonas sp. Root720]